MSIKIASTRTVLMELVSILEPAKKVRYEIIPTIILLAAYIGILWILNPASINQGNVLMIIKVAAAVTLGKYITFFVIRKLRKNHST